MRCGAIGSGPESYSSSSSLVTCQESPSTNSANLGKYRTNQAHVLPYMYLYKQGVEIKMTINITKLCNKKGLCAAMGDKS